MINPLTNTEKELWAIHEKVNGAQPVDLARILMDLYKGSVIFDQDMDESGLMSGLQDIISIEDNNDPEKKDVLMTVASILGAHGMDYPFAHNVGARKNYLGEFEKPRFGKPVETKYKLDGKSIPAVYGHSAGGKVKRFIYTGLTHFRDLSGEGADHIAAMKFFHGVDMCIGYIPKSIKKKIEPIEDQGAIYIEEKKFPEWQHVFGYTNSSSVNRTTNFKEIRNNALKLTSAFTNRYIFEIKSDCID